MDILFLSSKIFLGKEEGPEFINGGIIVTTEGKIRKILRTAGEVNSYVYTHESEAVRNFYKTNILKKMRKNINFNRCLILKIKC